MRRLRENRDQGSQNLPQKRQKLGEDDDERNYKDATNLELTTDHAPDFCPHENHQEESLQHDLVLEYWVIIWPNYWDKSNGNCSSISKII